mgnify:CR=1 FL=1
MRRVISLECDVEGCGEPGVVYLRSLHFGQTVMCLRCAGLESVDEWLRLKGLASKSRLPQERSRAE